MAAQSITQGAPRADLNPLLCFHIADSEMELVRSAKDQLSLVSTLLAGVDSSTEYTHAEMLSFMWSVLADLKEFVAIAEERHQAERVIDHDDTLALTAATMRTTRAARRQPRREDATAG